VRENIARETQFNDYLTFLADIKTGKFSNELVSFVANG
jgi:hypothetical protein